MNSLTRTENQALARTVLELDVNNHPGVMSHVFGLFSRRAYNVEGILVMPVGSRYLRQELLVLEKDALGGLEERRVLPVAFVPLTGAAAE